MSSECWLRFSQRFRIVVVALAIVGAAGRLAYLDRDYFSPDDEVAVAVAGGLDFPERWDTSWEHAEVRAEYDYPQYNFSSYHYVLYWWNCLLSGGRSEPVMPVPGRALNALFGAIAIFCTGWAARRLAGGQAGVAAAALVAISPLLVQDAHYLRCESMLTAGSALVLWLMLGATGWSRLRCLAAGAVCGWLAASKLPIGLVVVGFALVAASWNAGRGRVAIRPVAIAVALVAVGGAVGFVAGAPFAVLRPDAYLTGMLVLQRQYAAALPPFTDPALVASLPVAVRYLFGVLGGVSVAMSAVGFVSGLRRHLVLVAALALPLLCALVLFGAHAVFSDRSYSAVLPFAAVLTGMGFRACIVWLGDRLPVVGGGLGQAVLVLCLLGASLATPSRLSWLLVVRGFSGQDRLEQTAFLEQVRSGHPEADLYITGLAGPEDRKKTLEMIETTRPLVVVVSDYYDRNTEAGVAQLQRIEGFRKVATREGLFHGLPVCSLHTNISPRAICFYFPSVR